MINYYLIFGNSIHPILLIKKRGAKNLRKRRQGRKVIQTAAIRGKRR